MVRFPHHVLQLYLYHVIILSMSLQAGHRLAFRAPYHPIDGPIEYVFNTVQSILTLNMHNITDGPTLRQEILNAVGAIQSFVNYFIHCGYWR